MRPPKQQRSREAWNRVLDAGVAILEDGGYDAFTIAAVCERAAVAPTAIYARTTSKDALFLAVYEHGIAAMLAEQEVFGDDARWAGLSPAELIRAAVAEMVGISLRHQRFLREDRPDLGGARGGRAARLPLRRRPRRRLHAGSCSALATPSGTPTPRRPPEPASARCSRRRSSASPTARPSQRRPRSTTRGSSRTSARPRCATCWPRESIRGGCRTTAGRRARGVPGRRRPPSRTAGGGCRAGR